MRKLTEIQKRWGNNIKRKAYTYLELLGIFDTASSCCTADTDDMKAEPRGYKTS